MQVFTRISAQCQNAFNLVLSAQAFHWVPVELGYAKAAQALLTKGHLALFWNLHPTPNEAVSLDEAYRTHAPTIASTPHRKPWSETFQEREEEIRHSEYFQDVKTHQFPWSVRYSTEEYLQLMNTYSDHRLLPAENQQALFNQVTEILNEQGGFIIKPYIAVLYIAQKK